LLFNKIALAIFISIAINSSRNFYWNSNKIALAIFIATNKVFIIYFKLFQGGVFSPRAFLLKKGYKKGYKKGL